MKLIIHINVSLQLNLFIMFNINIYLWQFSIWFFQQKKNK